MSKHLIVYDQHPLFFEFAEQRLDVRYDPAVCRTIAHLLQNEDGTCAVLCVVVANNWTDHSVELSIASEPGLWATRRFINAVYQTVFYRWRKERIHMVAEVANAPAIAMHERLRHKYEGHLDDWFGRDRPAHIYGLTKRAYEKSKWQRSEGDNKHELPSMEA